MNFQAVRTASGQNVQMNGVITEFCQEGVGNSGKPWKKVNLSDGTERHKVTLRGTLPPVTMLNQPASFNLGVFQGTSPAGPYTGYSGFWNDRVQVQQPIQQAAQTRPAAQPQQAAPPPQAAFDKNDIITVAKRMQEKINNLVSARNRLEKLAVEKAQAAAEYDKALALALIRLKNGVEMTLGDQKIKDTPASTSEKIAKGLCFQEKLAMDLADTGYKSVITAINSLQAELNGYQSIFRHLEHEVEP